VRSTFNSIPYYAVAVAIAVLVLLVNREAAACTCIQNGSTSSVVKQAFDAPGAIFSARVLRVSEHATPDGRVASADMEVIEVWKGSMSVSSVVAIGVAPSEGGFSCQESARAGEELLVFVSGQPPYQLVACSLSQPLAGSEKVRKILDRLRKSHEDRSR